MEPKLQRIFTDLKNARREGVLELDLLNDMESSGNTRNIKSKLNKAHPRRLRRVFNDDKAAVYTEMKDGKLYWFLHQDYWDIGIVEFRELIREMLVKEQRRYDKMFQVFILIIVIVFLFIIKGDTEKLIDIGYEMGVPNNIHECGSLFDYNININD